MAAGRAKLVVSCSLSLALAAGAAGRSRQPAFGPPPDATYKTSDLQFHKVVPLGADAVRLEPSKAFVTLVASATSSGFEGLHRFPRAGQVVLVGGSGDPVRMFPERVLFRVTANIAGDKIADDPLPLPSPLDAQNFMLGLHFRLKIFDGLKSSYLKPSWVQQIGVPAELPADQRIYVARFHLRSVPATDRLVLEVLDSEGRRVARFHLELL